MTLWQEAPRTFFLGAEVYAWGLYVFFGALLCALVLFFLCRRRKAKRGTAVLTALLMLVCGLVCGRLLYALTDDVMSMVLSPAAVLRITGGGWSMFGALFGAMLGAYLAQRLLREKPGRMMDMAALGLMLFMAAERLGEGCLEESGFGLSRAFNSENTVLSFLMLTDEYGDSYLCTYKLESLFALICFVLGMRYYSASHRNGDTALSLMVVFGAGQVLLESLRYDHHMRIRGFVGIQHILAYCVLTAGCAVFIVRVLRSKDVSRGMKRLAYVLASALPLLVGVLVGLEFMIDRSAVSNVLIYAVYILLLCAVVFAGLRLRGTVPEEKKA